MPPYVTNWRKDFPFTGSIYLDSAASAQKPGVVLTAMDDFYKNSYGNTHRGVHALTQKATIAYESARAKVASFLKAPEGSTVVFTRGTTSAINLVAQSWGRANISQGDTILLSTYEHHSNFLPWVALANEKAAHLKLIPLTSEGHIDKQAYQTLLELPSVKLVALSHASNVLGSVSDLASLIPLAKAKGARVLIDGAQAVAHLPVDFATLGADFYAFSAHKLYGPTGIGALVIAPNLADTMPPCEFGGGMVHIAQLDNPRWAPAPYRFEAGTPPIAEAVGLSAAIDYLQNIGFPAIMRHETELAATLQSSLQSLPFIKLHGPRNNRVGVFSFEVIGVHPHDVGTVLDAEGIAVRVGHHCAQPLMRHLGVDATVRASLGLYNSAEDISSLIAALTKAHKKFA